MSMIDSYCVECARKGVMTPIHWMEGTPAWCEEHYRTYLSAFIPLEVLAAFENAAASREQSRESDPEGK